MRRGLRWGLGSLPGLLVLGVALATACAPAAQPGEGAKPAAEKPAVQAQPAAREERTIELAAYWPMTGPSRIAGTIDEVVLKAVISEVNNAGGVKLADGAIGKFKYTIFDDRCKADEGLTIIPKVASGPYLLLIGPVCSSVAEPTFGILQKKLDDPKDTGYQFPIWADTSIAEGLAAISDWAFRNTPSEGPMFEETLRWLMKTQDAKTVAEGWETDFAHAVSSHRHAQNAIKAVGIQQVADQRWLWLDTEVSSQIRALKQSNADLWILNVHSISGCAAASEMARQGVKVGERPKAVMTLVSFVAQDSLKNCGDLIKGWYTPVAFAPVTTEAKRVSDLVLKSPGGDEIAMGNAAVWEIVVMTKQLMEESGIVGKPETLQQDRRKLRDAIANMGIRPTLLGPTIMGPTGDMAYKPWFVVTAKDSPGSPGGRTWASVEGLNLDIGPVAHLKRTGQEGLIQKYSLEQRLKQLYPGKY